MSQNPTPWWAQTQPRRQMPSNQNQSFNPGGMTRYPFNPMQGPVLNGRYVDSENDIQVGDVPTDGSVAYFPTNDYSCIIAKAWANDGQIRVMRYVADIPKEPEKPVLVPQTPEVQQNPPVQQPQTLTAEQVSQMIDLKLNQLVMALTSQNANNMTVQPSQAQQPPKKVKKEETTQ